MYNKIIGLCLSLGLFLALNTTTPSLYAQTSETGSEIEYDFSDRRAVLETIKNFYIGDHTGSIKHKKLSMHPDGAYRWVNKEGVYGESKFRLDSDNADPNYVEELLSVDIYERVAIAKLRLKQNYSEVPEFKLMTLHKTDAEGWLITGISWGFGVVQ